MAYLLQRLLTEAAAWQPQRPAVVSDGCLLTYQELDRLSNQVARALLRLGVASGDRVGILAPKSAAAVIGLRWHYLTDTVGGAAVAVAVVVGLALLLDRVPAVTGEPGKRPGAARVPADRVPGAPASP